MTTNKERLDRLAHDDPHALAEWFAAEHETRDDWQKAASGAIYEYRAELERVKAERDELKAKVDGIMDEPDYRDAWGRMRKERDEWRAKAEKAGEEAEGFREKLSQAIGHAVDIIALQDLTTVDAGGEVGGNDA